MFMNIWILTEERPKPNVIQVILKKIGSDKGFTVKSEGLRIMPVIRDGQFTFTYMVSQVSCAGFDNVFIKIASGSSSFVDFLVFLQEPEPDQNSIPLYAIEETKTDDSESRNTGVYQRCSKFVYIEFYYPGIRRIMLYDLQISQKEEPTETNIFGTRMLCTVGVEILGKVMDDQVMKPFNNLEELVQAKKAMRKPPAGNVPIAVEVHPDRITVSGRLYKAGGIGHDPNIGALTMIAFCIRKWEKAKAIVVINHGLKQDNIGESNKFIQIANRLNMSLEDIVLPIAKHHDLYWHFETSQEKVATIFLHVVLLAYTNADVIYANHGGSERGYFIHKTAGPIQIAKYQVGKRAAYKDGDKTLIIHLPDMIIFDQGRNQIICVEGKRYATRQDGIEELKNYSYIEKKIIKPSHNPDSMIRTVVVFGSTETSISEKQIGFLLNSNGQMILGSQAPEIFREAIRTALTSQDI
jgi:hypothetical protein